MLFGGINIAQATHADQSACETAALNAASVVVAEARGDVVSGLRRGGKMGRRWIKEGAADLKKLPATIKGIEAVCEPNEGTQGGEGE